MYFDTRDKKYAVSFEKNCEALLEKQHYGMELLGNKFYCVCCQAKDVTKSRIEDFVKDIRESFEYEMRTTQALEESQGILDYVVCGGAMEGHRLQKEVNFSDTLVHEGALCRMPGSIRGLGWCSVNAHGWFSYEVAVTPNANNMFEILMGSSGEDLDVSIHIDEQNYTIHDRIDGAKEYCIQYQENMGKDKVRIRFDKLSGHTPFVFIIKVKGQSLI